MTLCLTYWLFWYFQLPIGHFVVDSENTEIQTGDTDHCELAFKKTNKKHKKYNDFYTVSINISNTEKIMEH